MGSSACGTGIEFTPALKYDHMSGDAISGPAAPLAQDGSYSYTYSTRAGAIALYHGNVLVDAVIYGSKQSNSSANGTIARPDLAVLEGEQTQGGCLAEVPQMRMPRGMNQSATAAPSYSLVRLPDGNDNDALCEIAYTNTPPPGKHNHMITGQWGGAPSGLKKAGISQSFRDPSRPSKVHSCKRPGGDSGKGACSMTAIMSIILGTYIFHSTVQLRVSASGCQSVIIEGAIDIRLKTDALE